VKCLGMQDTYVTHALLTAFIVLIFGPPVQIFFVSCLTGFKILSPISSETSYVAHRTTVASEPNYSMPAGNVPVVVTPDFKLTILQI
jgi:hypothetical protein